MLRYDKRSCGRFNGCAENDYPVPELEGITEDVFIDDAEAALDYLAARPDVGDLFFVGHSEGAQFAPRVLTERPRVRAGVMLAGPHGTITELLRLQNDKIAELLRATGTPQQQIDQSLADARALVRDLEALEAGTFQGDTIDGLPASYWLSWIDVGRKAPGLALALDRPLLALSGDYDWNVPPSETEAWRGDFQGTPHQVTLLPCVTHALNCVAEPDPLKVRQQDIGRHVHRSVIDAGVMFLRASMQ